MNKITEILQQKAFNVSPKTPVNQILMKFVWIIACDQRYREICKKQQRSIARHCTCSVFR